MWVFLFESREKRDKYSPFKGISVSVFSVIRTSMRERKATLPLFKKVFSIYSVLKQIYSQTSKGVFFSYLCKDKLFFKGTYFTKKKIQMKISKVSWAVDVAGYEESIYVR